MKYFARLIAVSFFLLVASQVGFGEPLGNGVQAKYRWKSGKIRIAVSRSLFSPDSGIGPESGVYEAVRRGVAAWNGIADVELVTELTDRDNANVSGAGGDGISLITIAPTAENILLFGKDDLDAAAKSRVFYNRRDHITEADIVLNPYQQFSTDGRYGTYDLESVISHEIGHLLGFRHNGVLGSVMYRTAHKNGVFGLAEVRNRQISAADKSALREIYGDQASDGCCGAISGKLIGASRSGRSFEVWVESVETGGVVGQSIVKRDGSFRLGGLETGELRVFGREIDRSGNSGIFEIGIVSLSTGETQQLNRKIGKFVRGISFTLLGTNGLLGDSDLSLARGQSYTIIVGGAGLNVDSLVLNSNSGFIKIENSSIRTLNDIDGISVVSFELIVDPETPAGSYTIVGVSPNGSTDAIVGGLTVAP